VQPYIAIEEIDHIIQVLWCRFQYRWLTFVDQNMGGTQEFTKQD